MNPPPRERVELSSSETVTERGTAKVSWHVKQGDGWVGAAEVVGVTQERLDAGPGTVWETRMVLELPLGTLLMRVESRPAPYQHRGVLDYLGREARLPPRRVRRSLYRVGRRGALVPMGRA